MHPEIEPADPAGSRHVVLVGGGLGVAPVFPQLRAFKPGRSPHHLHRRLPQRRAVVLARRLSEWADELIVCTDDGSAGRAGLVTAALADVLPRDLPDLVVAIGPMVMMRACAEVTRPFGVHTVASLNTIMVDGTGMCGSCRVTVDGHTRFACVDGPDFDAHGGRLRRAAGAQPSLRREERGNGRLRAPLPGGADAVRRRQAHLQEAARDRAHQGADARARRRRRARARSTR
jgi:glutamate synthase (NADPH/NADH) small chain